MLLPPDREFVRERNVGGVAVEDHHCPAAVLGERLRSEIFARRCAQRDAKAVGVFEAPFGDITSSAGRRRGHRYLVPRKAVELKPILRTWSLENPGATWPLIADFGGKCDWEDPRRTCALPAACGFSHFMSNSDAL